MRCRCGRGYWVCRSCSLCRCTACPRPTRHRRACCRSSGRLVFYGAFFALGYLGQGWVHRLAALRQCVTLLLAGVAASAVFLALLSFELWVRRGWFGRAVLGRKRS